MQSDTNTATATATDPFSQIIERIGSANNVLVTISANPSVDQLAACIGLTLALNKQGKHATCVFSGQVPSTLEFLQPERTIETDTNSLRDFIISLDKSKADKLRYKVEDDFVKIFITPYRTSIDDKDLTFSQGDFNIDLIITIGVKERTDLDGAIIAHGRILHDATVASLTTDTASEVGSINWVDPAASSLSEMVSDVLTKIDKNIFDSQVSTALLTGMVAETDRFGNEKVRPHTMEVSSVLMAAGASPQLISNQLKEPEPEPEEPAAEIPEVVEQQEAEPEASVESSEVQAETPVEAPEPAPEPKEADGTIKIAHDASQLAEEDQSTDDIHIDEEGKLRAMEELLAAQEELNRQAAESEQAGQDQSDNKEEKDDQHNMILEPPQLSGQLTANTIAEHEQTSPSTDPMSVASPAPLLERTQPQTVDQIPNPPAATSDETLTDIERSVNSLHLEDGKVGEVPSPVSPPPVDDARAAVEEASESQDTYRPEPINALSASPMNLDLGHNEGDVAPVESNTSVNLEENTENQEDKPASDSNPNSPPPVPPPMMPPGL